MFSKEVLISWLFGLLRVLTASISALLIEKGIATQGQWELLLTGLAGFIATIIWMYADKVRIRVEGLTALKAPSDSTMAEVKAKIKEGIYVPSATPDNAVPKLVREVTHDIKETK